MHLQQWSNIGGPLASGKHKFDLQQQVAKQLSALLYVAHVLRLQPLLSVLHQFLLLNAEMPSNERLLSGVMGLVFTDAVLEAAIGNSTFSKEAYVSSVTSQPCSLTPGIAGHGSLLKPVGPITHNAVTNVLKFDAQLLQDFAGVSAGSTVTVELDLFGHEEALGMLRIESAHNPQDALVLPAQLLLGYSIQKAAALQEFLTVRQPK
jgi:hypothetical protein